MVIATEELSRASLGIGGSLITRPEILTRALVKGGTEEQKLHWLPKLATAEVMAAVAVTEPDYGSDVAGLKVTATPADGPDGAPGYVINGVKTWCTFAGQRRRADAARPHRPRPFAEPSRPQPVHRAQAAWRGPRLRVHAGRAPGREDGGPADRHDRLPRHAQLRDRPGGLVGAGRPPDRRRRRPRAGLLLPDGGLRERPAADRGPGHRRDAGGLRGGARLRPQPQRVRLEHRRLPAHAGQARADGGAHPGRPAVQLPRRHADGQGPGRHRGEHGQGLRVQGRRVGHPRGDADPRRLRLRRGVRRQPAVRRRPRAVDLRGRRRDALPQGHRPPRST